MMPAGSTAGARGYMMACEPEMAAVHRAPSGHIAASQRISTTLSAGGALLARRGTSAVMGSGS